MTIYRYIFYALIATALFQVVYYYPRLPQVVASHFDGAGQANGWSSRNFFFGIYLGMVLLVVAIFAGLPRWTVKRGNFGLKIPNRDYWLAPERLDQTRDYFRRYMMVMGVAHLLLAVVTIQLAIQANLQQVTRLDDGIYLALGLYFVFITVWLLVFYRHFRKP